MTLTSNFDLALGLAQLQEVEDPSDTAGSGLCCEGYDPDTSDKSTPLLNSTKVLQEVDGLWVIFPWELSTCCLEGCAETLNFQVNSNFLKILQ